MSRTSVVPYSGQSDVTLSLSVKALDMSSNYAVVTDEPGETVVTNIGTTDRTLEELISFKYVKKNAQNYNLNRINPRSSNNAFQISISDAFIQRTTETDGTVHDDPIKVWVNIEAPQAANIVSGSDLLAILDRINSAARLQTGESASSTYLDRLMRGATKPTALV